MQELVSSTEWRDRVLLYPDKVEIEEVNNMKLDLLIDIDNLSLSSKKKNFIVKENNIPVSTFGTKSFYSDKVSFDLDLEKCKEEILLLCLDDDSMSKRKINCTTQTTEKAKEETQEAVVQVSQSAKRYGKPPVPE